MRELSVWPSGFVAPQVHFNHEAAAVVARFTCSHNEDKHQVFFRNGKVLTYSPIPLPPAKSHDSLAVSTDGVFVVLSVVQERGDEWEFCELVVWNLSERRFEQTRTAAEIARSLPLAVDEVAVLRVLSASASAFDVLLLTESGADGVFETTGWVARFELETEKIELIAELAANELF